MYRIFLVEDDETIAKLVRRHLEKWDYDVHVVQKFDAVMSEFASFDPHLVLMDIGLPFYNGYHWCTEIRRVSKVPVVFLSSAADNMNIVMAVSMGADDFIAKPFDLDVLTVRYRLSSGAAMILAQTTVFWSIMAPCSIYLMPP